MNLVLRPYQKDDFEALLQIDQACYPPGIAYTRRGLREFLTLPGSVCQVALLDGKIVGFLIALHKEGQGHIITADVLEDERRQGIGSDLLEAVERELASHGVSVVELETATNNDPAIAFWMRRGYEIVGRYPRYYARRIDAYVMIKRLRPARRPPPPGSLL